MAVDIHLASQDERRPNALDNDLISKSNSKQRTTFEEYFGNNCSPVKGVMQQNSPVQDFQNQNFNNFSSWRGGPEQTALNQNENEISKHTYFNSNFSSDSSSSDGEFDETVLPDNALLGETSVDDDPMACTLM